MGLKWIFGLPLALSAILANPGAIAREAVSLEPSSSWQLDYGDEKCTLARSFGEGDKATTLLAYFWPESNTPLITLVGNEPISSLKSFRAQFWPDGHKVSPSDPASFALSDGRTALVFFLMLPKSRGEEPLQAGDPPSSKPELRIEGVFEDDLLIQTGTLDKAIDAVRDCTASVGSEWGLSPRNLSGSPKAPVPKGNPAGWVKPGDYPPGLRKLRATGLVHFLLVIGDTGKPQKCVIMAASAGFAEKTCELLMARAEFEPAKDGAGNPITSTFRNSVRWIPNF